MTPTSSDATASALGAGSAQSSDAFTAKTHRVTLAVLIRGLVAATCLAAIAVLWWWKATQPDPGEIFGRFRVSTFVTLLGVTYCLAWAAHFSLDSQRLGRKIARCALFSLSLAVGLTLPELPVLFGRLDYRFIIPPGERFIPTFDISLSNPQNLRDPELLHIHRPGLKVSGQIAGDLVYWLGIATDRRYSFDIQIDSRGFRNDHEILEAPVVAIGDSFLEAGLVPAAELLTTRLSRSLRVEVANLGQVNYGPQQELIVLRRYALDLHPKTVLWFFYEGNDLSNARRYENIIRDWPVKMHQPDSFYDRSFNANALLLLGSITAPGLRSDTEEARRRSCRFTRSLDAESRTLYFGIPGAPMSSADLAALSTSQEILLQASASTANIGAKLVVAFVPTKYRVYRDYCDFPADGYGRAWEANDFPERLRAWSEAMGLAYLDLTPPLREAAARGDLVYFTDDGHWTPRGHAVVAQALADYLLALGALPAVGRPAAGSTGG